MAVLPLKTTTGIQKGADFLVSQIEQGLVGAGVFLVLERSQMDAILSEQGFQQSGVCDQESCNVEVGKLLGVDKIIVTTMGTSGMQRSITAKLVDVQTGSIDRVATFKGEGMLGDVAKQGGERLGWELSGKVNPADTPFFKKPLFWSVLGACAIIFPTVIYYSNQTVVHKSQKTVGIE